MSTSVSLATVTISGVLSVPFWLALRKSSRAHIRLPRHQIASTLEDLEEGSSEETEASVQTSHKALSSIIDSAPAHLSPHLPEDKLLSEL